jgi:filamentous hemagglutinin
MQANQAGLALRNSGTMVAAGDIGLTAASINNDGGKLATTLGSNANVMLNAQSASNQGGTIMSDNRADLHITGDVDNRGGLLQARTGLDVQSGGTVKNDGGNIEAISATSTLHLEAGDLANETGRIGTQHHHQWNDRGQRCVGHLRRRVGEQVQRHHRIRARHDRHRDRFAHQRGHHR